MTCQPTWSKSEPSWKPARSGGSTEASNWPSSKNFTFGTKRLWSGGSIIGSRGSGCLGSASIAASNPWRVDATPDHAGCKTWVPLDPPWRRTGLSLSLVTRNTTGSGTTFERF